MQYAGTLSNTEGRGARVVTALAIALALGGAALGNTAFAADPKKPAAPAAKAAAPAKDAAAAPAKDGKGAAPGKQSAWVKLCEKAAFGHKDKDGKEVKEEKDICLTHHERLDGNTGTVLVSAAIRQVEGAEKQSLMVMVPLGMAIPAGLRAAVYSKEQWEKAAKNEKIDEKALKPMELKYALCHPAGCTAETEATPELIEQMKTGGGLMVLAINAGAQPIGFPVPLEGFKDAFTGQPADNKEYAKARGQLLAQIQQRQKEAYEQFKKEQDALRGAVGAQTPPAAGAAPAPAAAGAAKK